MLDLSKVEQSDTVEVPILHPVSQEETGASITVYGRDSKHYNDYLKKRQNAKIKAVSKRGAKPSMTAESLEEEALAVLVEMTVSCSGFGDKGKAVEIGKDDVKELYLKHQFIKDQVDAAIHDRALFIKG